ncbi:nitrous oxide-stimulated promoter family protein [Bacillus mycoides]|uniref:nitrous oxide-stimulated promoter family protein n=1 Tax=Bacillus mycoides TaxID=1405 RepID=UPI00187A41E3|nr:nitrous oxide-stimulated promoter family protein [Bacillus mycoides]MBE7128006.1 nitrous oxide-stimulated promoter family protein [Bacillus mycoides]
MNRIEREEKTISIMIDMYCKNEHKQDTICEKCQRLKDYAYFRLSKCPFQEKKPACQNCKIHCYKPDMKGLVKDVMKMSGPKMLLKHPYFAFMHAVDIMKKSPDLPKRKKCKKKKWFV